MLTAADTGPLQIERTKKRIPATMPIGNYFKGKGRQVMGDMQDRYGEKDGTNAFYATAAKNKLRPQDDHDADDKPKAKKKSLGQQLRARAT